MTGIALLERMKEVNIADMAVAAIEETKDVLVDAVATQMASGHNKFGERLNDYSPFTVRFKKEFGKGLGAVTDRRTLFMTGAHYKGLYAKLISKKEIEYGSSVSYADKIQEREGKGIYGPGADAREEYTPVSFEVFKRLMEEKTGLKFTT